MPVRSFNRQQTWLLPPTLDELLPDDHPARFVAMIVDSQDSASWKKMEIKIEGEPLGAPNYHPRAMLGVWLYGFMTGTRTSRKLESACRDQIPYLWLTGWQHPDHNSLWRFYKAHRKEMRYMFKLTVKAAVKMNLIDLAVQAIDGTKIAANASRDQTYDRQGLQKLLARTEKAIEELEKENEAGLDPEPVHLPEKLRKAEQLRTEVKAAIETLRADEDRKRINLTDGDTKLIKNRQGIMPGYNMESAVSPVKESKKNNVLITAVEVITETTDTNQLIPMLEQASENTGEKANVSLADAGYHSGSNLAECEKLEQVIVMPETKSKSLSQPYHKDRFIYDVGSDSYLCPCGQTLKFMGTKTLKKTTVRVYRGSAATCRQCQAFGICTKNKRHGRELKVGKYDASLRWHRDWMNTEAAKTIFKRRKELIEPVFGIIKEQMGIRRFLLRGLNKVRTEAGIIATAFNLRTLFSIWRSGSKQKHEQWTMAFRESGTASAS
jgi:transposase